jgi:hypothetical protein
MRRFLAVLTLVAAVAVPVVSGCGSEDLPSVSIADAAQATRDAHTARMTLRTEVRGFGLPGTYAFTGEGVSATDAPEMDVTFDLSTLVEDRAARARVVVDGGRVYADVSDIEDVELPGEAWWVTVDLARLVEAFGIEPAGLREVFHLSPAQQLAALEAAGNVKEVGEEEVGGVRTTHLRGTTTLRDYARTLPAERRAQFDQALRQLAELVGDELQELDAPTPTDLWVDEDAHIRRMTATVDVPAEDDVAGGSIKTTLEFKDFGTELRDFEPPSGEDVFDATRPLVRELRKLR